MAIKAIDIKKQIEHYMSLPYTMTDAVTALNRVDIMLQAMLNSLI